MPRTHLHRAPIEIRQSPIHGYGVFALSDIEKDTVIEECHTIFTSNPDPAFSNYYFKANNKQSVIPLGFGSIYNHSNTPNAAYQYDSDKELLIFTAIEFIGRDEEIYCSYGKAWFDTRNMTIKKIPLWRRITRKSKMPLRALIVFLGLIGLTQVLIFLAGN